VTPSSGEEVGTCEDRLSFQGFGRRIRVGLGRDSGGDRCFEIHCDDGNYFSARGFHDKPTAISTSHLSRNGEKKGDCAIVAGRGMDFRGSKSMASDIQEQCVIGNMKRRGQTRTWLGNE
jgi:hypothetical protein